MKYLLIAERGRHYVCLNDRTRIPFQIKTTVEQANTDSAMVTVSAYIDKRVGFESDKRIEFDHESKTISLCGKRLRGVSRASLMETGEQSLVFVEFTVKCVILDSTVKSKDLNRGTATITL